MTGSNNWMMTTMMESDTSRIYFPILATTAAACALATICYSYNANGKKLMIDEDCKEQDVRVVELLPIEQTLASGGGGDNAMSTFTWLKVPKHKDADVVIASTIKFLKQRTKTILTMNPWLTGRVQKFRSRKYKLVYSKSHCDQKVVDEYFHITPDLIQSRYELSLEELGTKLAPYLLKTGPNEPLWKVNIITTPLPSKEEAEADSTEYCYFAVVVSMSHVIGDGETFYKIQNMLLDQTQPEVSLIVERITTTETQQIDAMGGKEEYGILSSAGFIINCIGGVLQSLLQKSKYAASSRIYVADQIQIEKLKKQYLEETVTKKYTKISSNDIVTSWFFQNCGCRNGFMAINWRNKLDGHTEQHAGNYENVMFYRLKDSSSPILIRKAITGDDGEDNKKQPPSVLYQRRVTNLQPMPTFCEMLTSTNAICSNWSSFSKPCNLPNIEVEEHVQIPLYNVASLLPSTMAICLIFRLPNSKLGLFVAGSSEKLFSLDTNLPCFLKLYED